MHFHTLVHMSSPSANASRRNEKRRVRVHQSSYCLGTTTKTLLMNTTPSSEVKQKRAARRNKRRDFPTSSTKNAVSGRVTRLERIPWRIPSSNEGKRKRLLVKNLQGGQRVDRSQRLEQKKKPRPGMNSKKKQAGFVKKCGIGGPQQSSEARLRPVAQQEYLEYQRIGKGIRRIGFSRLESFFLSDEHHATKGRKKRSTSPAVCTSLVRPDEYSKPEGEKKAK